MDNPTSLLSSGEGKEKLVRNGKDTNTSLETAIAQLQLGHGYNKFHLFRIKAEDILECEHCKVYSIEEIQLGFPIGNPTLARKSVTQMHQKRSKTERGHFCTIFPLNAGNVTRVNAPKR